MRNIKCLALLIAVMMVLSLNVNSVLAYDKADNVPDNVSENPNYAYASSKSEDMTKSGARNIVGSSSIGKTGSGKVSIYGRSDCSPSDSNLKVTLYLQAYHNGAWTTLQTTSATANGTYVSKTTSYTVTPGFYYRVKGYHSTSSGKYTYTYTNSIKA